MIATTIGGRAIFALLTITRATRSMKLWLSQCRNRWLANMYLVDATAINSGAPLNDRRWLRRSGQLQAVVKMQLYL